jgi:hypothetical protein
MGDEEVMSRVAYRGYLLIQRVYRGSGIDRIRRPDGTWRYSYEAVSYEAACQWVDRRDDVLQELASSGRYPVAPLARAVLDGALDALGPLADALEEAGDRHARQVRGWINT